MLPPSPSRRSANPIVAKQETAAPTRRLVVRSTTRRSGYSSSSCVRSSSSATRQYYQKQFVDPITGRKETRFTGVDRTGLKRDRVEAEHLAAKWEAELREGRYCDPSRTTWSEFRTRYDNEVLNASARKTLKQCDVVFDLVEVRLNPQRVRDVTAQRLSWKLNEVRRSLTSRRVRRSRSVRKSCHWRRSSPSSSNRLPRSISTALFSIRSTATTNAFRARVRFERSATSAG